MNNKFKLEYYFTIYKEKPFRNRDTFRKDFKKKHGNFKYLNELIEKIEKYQFKKYGGVLIYDLDFLYKGKEAIEKENLKENQRKRQRRKRKC